jgi:hypothetical protein
MIKNNLLCREIDPGSERTNEQNIKQNSEDRVVTNDIELGFNRTLFAMKGIQSHRFVIIFQL